MGSFRYQARAASGEPVAGVIEAEDRREALGRLAEKGLFPSRLDFLAAPPGTLPDAGDGARPPVARNGAGLGDGGATERRARIPRKQVSAFTREMATLLSAGIAIPAALEGLGRQEESAAFGAVILEIASAVRRGNSLSAALEEHPRLFPPLYSSMVRVGEESGALDKVMIDLADMMENEDEMRAEVLGAVAYPCFVLALGIATTFILLAFVLPRLFDMLQGMQAVLPLPTRLLLAASGFFQLYWPWVLGGGAAALSGLVWCFRTPEGGLWWDTWKLRLPVLGPVFRAAALGRFARTLGTLAHSGVSLLPALEIVRNTVGNRFLAASIALAAEDTRGGDSLAAPLKKLGLFPPTMVQMIAVGEESGRLDAMLLRVAAIQERLLRGRSRALISLLAPALILAVGALVGFIVMALLLPIFRMSQAIH
jgi:general secretion pathway protein F